MWIVPDKRVQNDACISSAEREEQVTEAQPKGNVPALRFPEFSGEWENCLISDFGVIITGNTPPTKDADNYKEGIKLWASPIDLGKSKWIYDTQTKLSVAGFDKTRKLPEGAILVTCIGSTIGKMGMATCEMATNQQINSIVTNSDNDKDFVYYAIESNFQKYLASVAVQAVPIISKSSFERLPNRRTTLAEQTKIGKFLSLIDKRIETQNKIIEDLKKLKSAIYQEMFGSLVAPTLKLGQVVEIVKGKQVNGTELLEQGDYYVMNGGTLPSGWLNKFNTEANTISISEGGNSCGYVQYNTSPYWSGGHCYSLKILHPQETSDLYLYHFLKWQEENIMALRIGSGLPNIQKKDLLRFPIILPTITQQNKIVSILSAIEEKVSCEISITKYFIMQKEYLLDQLFI